MVLGSRCEPRQRVGRRRCQNTTGHCQSVCRHGSPASHAAAGLAAATKSTDSVAPTSFIQSPVAGATIQNGVQTQIAGTATDSGGQVWGVEVSTDGGNTWQPAVGRGNWSYGWTPAASGPVTIKTRAVDDSGNLETPSSGVAVSVAGVAQTTIWPSNSVPAVVDQGPDSSVELGVKFYSEVGGAIKGIRFYKSSANTGTHVANLWSESGTLMASATFANETPSGWQQVNFATPVPINRLSSMWLPITALPATIAPTRTIFHRSAKTIRRCTLPQRRIMGCQWCLCLRRGQRLPNSEL